MRRFSLFTALTFTVFALSISVPLSAQPERLLRPVAAFTDLPVCRSSLGLRAIYVTGEGVLCHCNGTSWSCDVSAGTVPAASVTAGVAVREKGNGTYHRSVFTLTAVSVAVTDATTAGAHGAIQLYDFPAGLVNVLGVTSDLSVTAGAGGIGDTASVVCGLGSATVATDNDALTSTEADLIPSTAATLTGGVGACDGQMSAVFFSDGTATAKDAFLNFAVPDAGSSANDTLTVAGTVTVVWVLAGDN